VEGTQNGGIFFFRFESHFLHLHTFRDYGDIKSRGKKLIIIINSAKNKSRLVNYV